MATEIYYSNTPAADGTSWSISCNADTEGIITETGLRRGDGSGTSEFQVDIVQNGITLATKTWNVEDDGSVYNVILSRSDYTHLIQKGAFTVNITRNSGTIKGQENTNGSFSGTLFDVNASQTVPNNGLSDACLAYESFDQTLNDNLIAYYKLDETSGTTVNDSHSTYNGTSSGCTVNQSGKIGTAYTFGTSASCTVTGFPNFNNQTFSMSWWCYPTAVGNNYIISRNGNYQFRMYPSSGLIGLDVGAVVTPRGTMTQNAWNHMVGIYDGTNTKWYINGVLRGKVADTGPTTSAYNLSFGVRASGLGGTSWFQGKLDEICFWDRPLTDGGVALDATATGEVAELYNSGSGLPYPFGEVELELTDSVSMTDNALTTEIIQQIVLTDGFSVTDGLIKDITLNLTDSVIIDDEVDVPETVISSSIVYNQGTISAARITLTGSGTGFNDLQIDLSADGGSNWERVTDGTLHNFTNTGTDLRWRIKGSNATITKIVVDQYK